MSQRGQLQLHLPAEGVDQYSMFGLLSFMALFQRFAANLASEAISSLSAPHSAFLSLSPSLEYDVRSGMPSSRDMW